MNAKITYLLSETAQRAQMAATGQPVARKQVIDADLPVTDLDVCYVHEDGACLLDCTASPNREALFASLPTGEATYGSYHFAAVPAPADIPALIRRGRALLASRKAADEDKEAIRKEAIDAAHLRAEEDAVRAFRSDPAARGQYDSQRALLAATGPVVDVSGAVPGGRAIYIRSHPDYDMISAEVRSRNADDLRVREEADARKEAAKATAISTWVTEHGTDSQRARQADGLLPRDEALTSMAELAFAAAGVPAKAEYRSCEQQSCSCGFDEIHTLSADAYAAWATVKAALPEGYAVKFYNNRECSDKDGYGDVDDAAALDHIVTANITIPFGPFRFEREIALT